MTPRERVKAAFAFQQPDCTPCDYFGTPEIHAGLMKYFGIDSIAKIYGCLGTDIRYILPPYIGPKLPEFADGSKTDIWGIIRKPMPNEYGEYAEPVNLPFAKWQNVEEAEKYNWPSPDWYDYSAMPALCEQYPNFAIATGGFGVQDFINQTAYGRGVEQVLIDIATENPVYLYIVQKRHRFFNEHIERILKAAKGRIDFVLCGDDFGTQRAPVISPASFDKIFAPLKKEFFDMVHSFDAKISHHSCGSTRQLIPHFIKTGMDALQTIQPRAAGMNPYELKKEFGGKIVLHGAVDVQGWLQKATLKEIRKEVNNLMDKVGKDGGYILAPCHNIQPDTPIENVLEIYRTVANRRDKTKF
ncbi:MAG: uroporphyrinogen decarboxylase family protein [Phycisphaerales bacterium]